MIKSINYWAFPGGLAGQKDLVEAMQEARDAGFDGIELCLGQKGELTDKTSEARCKELIAAAKRIGIKIVGTASGEFWGMSLTDAKKGVRDKALAFLKGSLEVTGRLKAGAMLVVPGCVHADFIPDCPELPYDFVYKTAQQQIRKALPTAKKHKVTIAVEVVWNKFLYSPLEFKQFVDSFKSTSVGAYFDVGNPVAFGVPADWVRILGRRIKRVHLKEYSRAIGGFPAGFDVPLGQGDVNYPAVVKALRAIKYKGPATVEFLNFDDDPGLVARASKEADAVL